MDIELTSALGDGTWTWRAAGAKQPKGVLDGGLLPSGASVGDELKVEVEQEIDGITVLGIVQGREKQDRSDVLELLPVERDFQPVVETRAKRERGERRPRRDGERRPRRDGDDRRPRRDGGGEGRGEGRGGDRRGDGERGDRRRRGGERRGPSFTPPPEVPQRPKPKRLKPGKAHRSAILDELPAEQRPIAELALQGMGAVRSRLKDENKKAAAEGRPTMPEASVLKMAEELLPRLRVAEWLDRAEAAKRQLELLDLRDLRSVVAAANDPMVARDESTRALATELQDALATKQEQELQLWFGDVDAALAVGRVIRALRLSSQPPKAGVPFPGDISQRLVDSTNAALAPMDGPDRWSAILEAAAFSPIRTLVRPARKPDAVSDELMATVKRLAPALPQVAELFEIEVAPDAPMPKPLRPGPRQRKGSDAAPKQRPPRRDGPAKEPRADKGAPDKGARSDEEQPATEQAAATEPTPAEQPTTDAPADADAAATEPTPAEQPTTDATTDAETAATEPTPAEQPTTDAPADAEAAATEPVPEEPAEPATADADHAGEPAAAPAAEPAATDDAAEESTADDEETTS